MHTKVCCCMYCVVPYHTHLWVHVRYSCHFSTSFSHTHIFCLAHRPNLCPWISNISGFFHINFISRAFGMLCPPLVHNIEFIPFMTERAIDVQMFSSLIRLEHIRLEWGLPVQMPVSETQWIFKTHSQPFILCCWNNNVSRAHRPPRLNIWENMCTSSTWLATFQHMRYKVASLSFFKTAQRLHHLTGKKTVP